ncbi:selection and upkeep of intraepithelial T-cells protein 7-like [Sorex araneus]|uniref:selection and upkeep of intraepithelial T-cells protein 7-like n=1 Tax=Sorex araneus TaxID=42254 RepID=UPI00243377FA|nr:selection and upkeep of intraepithelial T-cells protein 7-like [Sorex araneus]
MNPKCFFCSGYCVAFILLQVKISTSEKWTVITSTGHLVATVGGQAELSCQLSPSQSAENLEVQWLKGKSSKLVYLFRGGHEVNEDIAREYVNRTEFVKTAIGKGKLTLRLHNISVSDDGTYQCLFKGENFSDVASINLSVAALGLKTQVHVQASNIKGLVVECNSGGWFPEPQMEWRNSKGEVIPHLSKSYSQDEAKLFHMEMTLFLPIQHRSNVTCYIFNSLLGKGRHTNITLTGSLPGVATVTVCEYHIQACVPPVTVTEAAEERR